MKHGCVVIADVHHNMLDGVRGLLTTKFESVIMVADMKSLKETAKSLKPDLYILDLSMPVSCETNPVEDFLSSFPESKLIVLSVHDDSSIADKIIKSGAAGFVLKRQTAKDLIAAVEEVLQGKIYVSAKC